MTLLGHHTLTALQNKPKTSRKNLFRILLVRAKIKFLHFNNNIIIRELYMVKVEWQYYGTLIAKKLRKWAFCILGQWFYPNFRQIFFFILLEPYNGKTKKTLGDRVFAAAAPRLSNSLPREIRHETCFNTFKTKVKPFFSHGFLLILSNLIAHYLILIRCNLVFFMMYF